MWTPQAFGQATHYEFTHALVGYRKKQIQQNPKTWTRKALRTAKKKFDQQQIDNPDGQIQGKKLPKEVRQRLKENRELRRKQKLG